MFPGSGFGTPSTSTAFGSFAKPATTGFAAPVFGSSNTSLFGQTAQPSTGLFAAATPAPAFGQTQTAQPSFGFASNTGGTGLFGSQQNATTSGTGLFGSSGTSAFGQAKPTFGTGFTSSNTGGSLFGTQLTTQAQTNSIFGQSATTGTSNLFGSTTGFGSTVSAAGNTGTTIKFTALTGTDTMVKNGVSQPINTRHHCITCMKEYEGKSLEELRLEDYAANRKGPQQGVQNTGGLFSQSTLFGSGPSTSTASGGLFGQTENKPLFGGTNPSIGFGGTSSVFGSPGGSIFGKPVATQPSAFGATSTTTNNFAFNTSSNTNPFGANTAQVKPFGSVTPQTNLFNSTTTQPTSGFGSTPSSGFGTFGATQPTQNIGLFQQNKSPFSVGGTANTGFGAFGQTAPTTTQTSTSLFGPKPATAGFGSTFGTQPAGTTTSFGSAFGTQNTGSIFGNTFKPPANNFSFGQTPTTSSTLGTGLNLGGGSLFANNANKPGGLFSNTTGGGLFGSSTTFGSTGNTGFGTGNTTGLGTSLSLGNTSMMGSNPFATAAGNPVNQNLTSMHISEALAAMPFGDIEIFKKILPPTGKAEDLLKPTVSAAAQKAILTGQNFKVSPHTSNRLKVKSIEPTVLTKKALFEGLDEEEQDSFFRMVYPSPKRLEIKSFRKENTVSEGRSGFPLMPLLLNKDDSPSGKKSPGSPATRLFTSLNLSDSSQAEQKTVNSYNIKNTSKEEKKLTSILKKPTGIDHTPNTTTNSSGDPENTIAELCHPKPTNEKTSAENKENIIDHSSSSTSSDSDTSEPLPHPAGIILKRADYYTMPSLEELAELVDSEGRCIVNNFTIGRHNYGNVYYGESFDVAGLNLDEIVHIRYKEITVYPDDEAKPPVGQGLNRPAQVTLDRVWPTDKTTRLPISDPEHLMELDYEATLRRASLKNNSRFKEYRPQTGSWVFKVDHFSKYGLSDSDDDEDVSSLAEIKKPRMNDVLPPSNFPPGPKDLLLQHGLNGSWMPPVQKANELVLDEDDQDMEDGLIKTPFDLDDNYQPALQSPTMHFARELGASSNKVQLMKASFFQDETDDYNIDGDYIDLRSNSILNFEDLDRETKLNNYPLLRTQFSSSFKSTEIAIAEKVSSDEVQIIGNERNLGPVALPLPPLRPPTVVLQCPGVIPYTKSTIAKINPEVSNRCLADSALMMGRSFRAGWAKDYTLLSLSTKQVAAETTLTGPLQDVGEKLKGRLELDMTPSIVQRIQVFGGQMEDSLLDFRASIEQHLEIALEHSIQDIDEHGCPIFAPKPGVDSMHAHAQSFYAQTLLLTENDSIFFSFCQVWDLCIALWGHLDDLLSHIPVESHHSVMERKRAVSEWLENIVSEDVTEDLVSQVCPGNVFALLTGHCILKACKHAQEGGDYHLGLLLSQLGGNTLVRALMEDQLTQWVETQADENIDINRMKLMMLVAGIPVLQATEKEINVCQDLDWRRAFAIHLWYVCSPVASVTDALLKYDTAFTDSNNYAKPPNPMYYSKSDMEWETSSGKPVYDICYHLLKLFSNRAYPLQPLLNPATYSPDPLDYRLSWLMLLTLESLGYSHLPEYSAAHIHTSFAAQLQSHGLWHWAIFVLLHITNPENRKSAVLDVLGRHINLEENTEQEIFLIEKLKLPEQWIYQAKTVFASSHSQPKLAAEYLIKAKQWNDSHSVIMQHISAQAIIDEKYDYLTSLLKEFTIDGRSKEICGWSNQGSLIWDYLNIVQQVNSVVAKKDPSVGYELEKLQPQLSSICTRINLLPTPTAKHRLSQVEIAKRIVHLIRTILFLQRGENDKTFYTSTHVLAHLVGQLPLPEDYCKQELHEIITSITNRSLL